MIKRPFLPASHDAKTRADPRHLSDDLFQIDLDSLFCALGILHLQERRQTPVRVPRAVRGSCRALPSFRAPLRPQCGTDRSCAHQRTARPAPNGTRDCRHRSWRVHYVLTSILDGRRPRRGEARARSREAARAWVDDLRRPGAARVKKRPDLMLRVGQHVRAATGRLRRRRSWPTRADGTARRHDSVGRAPHRTPTTST